MQPTEREKELRALYATYATEYLRELRSSGTLTDMAQELLDRELASRGVSPDEGTLNATVAGPEDTEWARIIKRVGVVLMVFGLIDFGVTIFWNVKGISDSLNSTFLNVVAGISLMGGSLRAASVVRWLAVCALAFSVASRMVLLFAQPLNLTLTQFRLNPDASLGALAFETFFLCFMFLLIWIIKELAREPIEAARARSGLKQQGWRIPAALGIGLVAVSSIFLATLLSSEVAARAMLLAEQQTGPGYRLHISSLEITRNERGTFVSGVVTAWNDNEIKKIPVNWQEH